MEAVGLGVASRTLARSRELVGEVPDGRRPSAGEPIGRAELEGLRMESELHEWATGKINGRDWGDENCDCHRGEVR